MKRMLTTAVLIMTMGGLSWAATKPSEYVQMGLFGLENLATEELAARKVYQFLFVLTHGKTRGSTAAVVAPAAIY